MDVVDASIAELPEAHGNPHLVLCRGVDGWRACCWKPHMLLLGRLAMEIDVVAFDLALLGAGLRPGDLSADRRRRRLRPQPLLPLRLRRTPG